MLYERMEPTNILKNISQNSLEQHEVVNDGQNLSSISFLQHPSPLDIFGLHDVSPDGGDGPRAEPEVLFAALKPLWNH